MTTCLRCRRPLTNPASIQLRFGPTCWAIKQAELAALAEASTFDLVDIPFDPSTMDIVCYRDARREIHVNIPQQRVWHSPAGFEWGYGGSGPADFALNILLLFVEPMYAEMWHQDFKWAFVAPLPEAGGTIPGDAIREWIAERDGSIAG